jgi:AraC family transcriptional regulator, carnitine catabolism transcriptional activator
VDDLRPWVWDNSKDFTVAGLLNGHAAAMHWDNLEGFQERYPETQATTQPFTYRGGHMTCAGTTNIADLLLFWIADHGEHIFAGEIGRHLILNRTRPAHEIPGMNSNAENNSSNPIVTRAMAIMQGAIEDPLSCVALAQEVGVSQRHLQRNFKSYLTSAVGE